MTKTIVAVCLTLTFGALAAATAYIVLVFDPFKWGLVQSENFSWARFQEVKKGDRIDAVVERLGQPVEVSEPLSVLTDSSRDPCARGCKKYVFAGALWGATFKEAFVMVDSKGNVIHAIVRNE